MKAVLSLFRFSGMGGSSTKHSTTTRTCCVRIKGRPWWIKGPKQAIPAKRGLQQYLCTVVIFSSLERVCVFLGEEAVFKDFFPICQKNIMWSQDWVVSGMLIPVLGNSLELVGPFLAAPKTWGKKTPGGVSPPRNYRKRNSFGVILQVIFALGHTDIWYLILGKSCSTFFGKHGDSCFSFRTCFWWSLEVFIPGDCLIPSLDFNGAWPVDPQRIIRDFNVDFSRGAKKRKKTDAKVSQPTKQQKPNNKRFVVFFFLVPFCFFR